FSHATPRISVLAPSLHFPSSRGKWIHLLQIQVVITNTLTPLLRLHFMPQRPDRLGEFLQAKFQTRFHRAQRSMGRSSNFAVSESLKKCELDCFTLKPWQCAYGLFEK